VPVVACLAFGGAMAGVDDSVEIGPLLRLGLIATAAVLGVLAHSRIFRAHDDRFVRGRSWALAGASVPLLPLCG
jgi:hypothetical protein